jgi:type IV pilus assembly protein PilO
VINEDKNMDGRFKKIIFYVSLIGLTVLSYQFMIRPANKVLAEQQTRLQSKSARLAEFEKATAAAYDLNMQLQQLQQAVKFFESKLPPTSEIYKVLEQVTIIAQKEGLQPKTIRTLATKTNSGYIEQPLRMELEGDFNSFYSFLLELEKLPRIMKIRSLDLKKINEPDGNVSADFTISIFFQST